MRHRLLDQPAVGLCGVPFAPLTEAQTVEVILEQLDQGQGGWLISLNCDVLRQWSSSRAIAEVCSGATMNVADGMPLLWASKLMGQALPGRVAGSDLIWSLSREAARRDKSVFLLGGDSGVAEEAASVLRHRYVGLNVVGTHCPPFGFEKQQEEIDLIRHRIGATQPDIVLVALGFPKQEHLIDQLRGDFPGVWWTGVGISFSFVAGRIPRAPVWMQRVGLEWVHRLIQEPGRLAKRYLVNDIPFVLKLLCASFFRKWAKRS